MTTNQPISEFHCPLCGKSKAKVLSEMDSFSFKVRYYLCQTCGFVFQNPGESAAADPAFYAETYRQLYQATEEPTAKDLRQQRLRAEYQLSLMQNHGVCRLWRALDIGASSGTLLQTIQEAYGGEMIGVEPGNAYRSLAEAKGFKVYPSLEQLQANETARFDLVTMMHVLEHLEDPLDTLRKIKTDLLDDRGFLLVEVPNFYAHESYELAHLNCFTEHSLSEMLKQAGYKVMHMRKHGYPRSETLDLYLSVLARPESETSERLAIIPERSVALKRTLGTLKRNLLTKLMPGKTWLPLEDEV
jgi:2-polyprenyl-3-methyl-5-hydroxy-6-metoxy-1,4-benzoquinol methylase/rubredoxin